MQTKGEVHVGGEGTREGEIGRGCKKLKRQCKRQEKGSEKEERWRVQRRAGERNN